MKNQAGGMWSVASCWLLAVVITVLVLEGSKPTAVGNSADQTFASESASLPSFEVASIKLNRRGEARTSSLTAPGGRYIAENMTLLRLVREAYELQGFQITGGPSWCDSDHYDVSAKALGNPSRERVRLMLRRLLIERFMLSLRTDTKELPLYSLVRARKNGAIGPRLRESSMKCETGVATPRVGPSPGTGCGLGGGHGQLSGRGVTMDLLAIALARPVGRFVRNGTGLSGVYDLDLEYTPEAQSGGTPESSPIESQLGDYPAVFTALQEQLGLKLQAGRGPVSVVVIVRAERPSEK